MSARAGVGVRVRVCDVCEVSVARCAYGKKCVCFSCLHAWAYERKRVECVMSAWLDPSILRLGMLRCAITASREKKGRLSVFGKEKLGMGSNAALQLVRSLSASGNKKYRWRQGGKQRGESCSRSESARFGVGGAF